ncbi:MAG: cell division protein FtsZ [Bacteroidota bacterium]|jgi:cell division protein FtsZ
MYKFELPSTQKSIIKVIGVGGGGSNAVNHMYSLGIKDVEFVVCNTDSQHLKASPVPNKLQLGVHLTEGLGAGGNPEVGADAALESREEIREMLAVNTKMVFITAGMGGGTGTGAAPVIAKISKELDILTVCIVTLPFSFEGKKKLSIAEAAVVELKKNCDTVIMILNDKLRQIHKNLTLRNAFAQADMVLTNAAKSIAEIITVTHTMNVDFNDVTAVMKNSGAAVMGSGIASGEGRAIKATTEALTSPLLNNVSIRGAKKLLVCVAYGEDHELGMDEMDEIAEYIQIAADGEYDELKFGELTDSSLGDSVKVTVIATGFEGLEYNTPAPIVLTQTAPAPTQMSEFVAPNKTVIDLESNKTKQISIFEEFEAFTAAKAATQSPNNEQEPIVNPIPPQVVRENEVKQEITANFAETNTSESIIFEINMPMTESQHTPSASVWDYSKDDQVEPQANTQVVLPLDNFSSNANTPVSEQSSTEKSLNDEIEMKRRALELDAQRRFERLKRLSENSWNSTTEDYKDKLEVPAYLRKNVNLQDVPHSSERNISKFNLNDDNEILGNNKFLHDNVD